LYRRSSWGFGLSSLLTDLLDGVFKLLPERGRRWIVQGSSGSVASRE
jgi:hypothetical protein